MSLPFLVQVQRCLTCCLFFWGLLLSPGGFFHVPARPAPLAQLKASLFCLALFLIRFSRSISLFNSFALSIFIHIHSFLSCRVGFTRSLLLFDLPESGPIFFSPCFPDTPSFRVLAFCFNLCSLDLEQAQIAGTIP